jgi:prepilin-type processing-associated H-X9-DG protein
MRAFTLLELLFVVGIIAILVALLLPALTKAQQQAKRAQCVSQLRQMGIAFQGFAHDHNGQFPMAVPANAGGTLETAMNAARLDGQFYFSYRHLQVLSNELVTPRILICPADSRSPGSSFSVLTNENVSYFVGINADYSRPNSILAGDRNVTNDWARAGSLARLGGNFSLRWTEELHGFKGNLLFSDGRVEEKNSAGLMAALNQFPAVAVLAIPAPQPTGPAVRSSSGAPVPPQAPPETVSLGTSSGPAPASRARSKTNDATGAAFVRAPSAASVVSQTANERTSPLLTNAGEIAKPGKSRVGSGGVQVANSANDKDGILSFLPPWVVNDLHALASKVAWAMYALLLVLVAATIVLRRWIHGKKQRESRPEYEKEQG